MCTKSCAMASQSPISLPHLNTELILLTSPPTVPDSILCHGGDSFVFVIASGYMNPAGALSYSASSGVYSGARPGRHRHYAPAAVTLAEPVVVEPAAEEGRGGDSISVTIRFRPLSERELQHGDEIAWYPDGDKMVRWKYNPATTYEYDRVFEPSATSKAVYEVAGRPIVKEAMDGVNGIVVAYGVTSSGKTHTMHGDHISPGIIPLAIKDVFSIIQDTPGREYLLRVSYLEICNEVINDLLDPTGQNLRLREDEQAGTYVEGIKEVVVLSLGHALSFIAAGEEHRHVGSNNFNLLSSRSHTVFTLMIESSAHGDEYDGVIFSQLNLIDLAGFESSKTETNGLRRKEGSCINKSLLTLGTIIEKLSEGRASHVPYRDSKLTHLLRSSLSGRGHVSLICTVAPASCNMEETHNTLKFASRAKRVEIYASRNRTIDEKSLIKKYQSEISILKQELEQFKKGMVEGANHEEIIDLTQQWEEGQFKTQTRLYEEEEAKAALMSRIQSLTKLILVSTKNAIPGVIGDLPVHHQQTLGEDDISDILRVASPLLLDGENLHSDSLSSIVPPDSLVNISHRRSLSKIIDENSPNSSSVTDVVQFGEVSSGMTPFTFTVVKLMAQCNECNEKNFLLELKSAENRVLQEQLQNKDAKINELQEKANSLQQLVSSGFKSTRPSEQFVSEDYVNDSNRNIQMPVMVNEKVRHEHVELIEENNGLRAPNQKLSEESSYAKELACAAAVELKNLAEEVTKLSLPARRKKLRTREANERQFTELIGPHPLPLIPGLPDEVAEQCLLRVAFEHLSVLDSVCLSWRHLLRSPDFHARRGCAGINRPFLFLNVKTDNIEYPLLFDPTLGTWDHLNYYQLNYITDLHTVVGAGRYLIRNALLFDDEVEVEKGDSYSTSVLIYDIYTGLWRVASLMPDPKVHFRASAWDGGGRVFLSGSKGDDLVRWSANVYHIEEDRWEVLPLKRHGGCPSRCCPATYHAGVYQVICDKVDELGYNIEYGDIQIDSFDESSGEWAFDDLDDIDYLGRVTLGKDGNIYCLRDGKLQIKDQVEAAWRNLVDLPSEVVRWLYLTTWRGGVLVAGTTRASLGIGFEEIKVYTLMMLEGDAVTPSTWVSQTLPDVITLGQMYSFEELWLEV